MEDTVECNSAGNVSWKPDGPSVDIGIGQPFGTDIGIGFWYWKNAF